MTEARARAEIVSYCARVYERRLVAGSSGNVSMRLEDGSLLVTPSGVSLRALAPLDLVRCTAEGVALGEGRPSSELPLHVAAYRVRSDVRCVIHTHPTFCVAWSKTGALFPRDTVGALESLGPLALTRYAPSGTQELADLCAAAFACGADTIVMERHGLSSVAQALETAFARTDLAEQTAHIEFAAFVLRASKAAFMQDDRPPLPLDEFRAMAAAPAAHAALDNFHAEYSARSPDRERLAARADDVRGHSALVGAFERWWLEPRVQAFIAELNATGL